MSNNKRGYYSSIDANNKRGYYHLVMIEISNNKRGYYSSRSRKNECTEWTERNLTVSLVLISQLYICSGVIRRSHDPNNYASTQRV
jgi:hypothetical protein